MEFYFFYFTKLNLNVEGIKAYLDVLLSCFWVPSGAGVGD